ncbi:hypothetical protein L195_g062917, partial [Trifolium pratense]
MGDVLIFEEEIFSSISVEAVPARPVQVEEVHANDLAAKKPRVDQQRITPELQIVGSWSDAVTDLDYIQDSPSW